MRSHKTNAYPSKEKRPKRSIFRRLFRRGKAQVMPASEWLSTKQQISLRETEKQPAVRPENGAFPPLAWPNTGALPPLPRPGTGTLPPLARSGPLTPLPPTYSPGQPRPGDMFRAYASRPENYHPRYPQAADRLTPIGPTSLVPGEAPALLTREKAVDRDSLFAVTEEEMQPDMNAANNDETARAPALYKMRVFLRTQQE